MVKAYRIDLWGYLRGRDRTATVGSNGSISAEEHTLSLADAAEVRK